MKTILTKVLSNLSKICAISAAFICSINFASAQVCTSPSTTIYSLSNAGGIYPVSVSNANVGSIVNSTSYGSTASANGIGYNVLNGSFYYFQNAISGTQQFISYNPITNTYATLAPSPMTGTVNKGCVNFNGTGYYCLDNNGNLCYYNILLNTWVLICSNFTDQFSNNVTSIFTSQGSGDMAIDGLGNLWIVTSKASNYGLYKLSAPLPTTSTASITVKQLIAPTTATPTGVNFVGIAFDPTGNIYMATNTDLYILKSDLSLSHLGVFSVAGTCGDLTSCNYPFSVLPVIWQRFSAVLQQNNTVAVQWQVSQQNTKGYYVEQSIDGSNWKQIGFVENNNSTSNSADYSFIDNNPAAGKNYYRICEVDMDGTETYSEIKMINVDNNNNNVTSIWPNPAKDVIHVQNSNNVSGFALIYNQSGALVSENKLQNGVNNINVNNLSFGIYIVKVSLADGESYNKKFIKQ